MLKSPFISKDWMCANENFADSEWILVGVPYDGTCSYRPGARFAPEQIRLASRGLEGYSPYFDKDLEDVNFFDAGELDLPFGNTERALEMVYDVTKEILESGKKYFGIGGEHLVSYPALKAYFEKYPDIYVIHFDAHTDLREDYIGEELSHATVIKRITDLIGFENITQIGIRSGEAPEFALMKKHNTLVKTADDFSKIAQKIGDRPVFVTLDLDVLDPSIMPGTGTPEPGGLSFLQMIDYFKILETLNVVGSDVLELAPFIDITGNSTVVAAKVIRELLVLSSNKM